MKKYFFSIFLVIVVFCLVVLNSAIKKKLDAQFRTSGAGKSLDNWVFERAYPGDKIDTKKYLEAFKNEKKRHSTTNKTFDGEWESLGPINIGGRTLCLAFHPSDPNIIYAGTAGGGLWKTTTQGVGQNAWEFVPTGFPVLGVASIAIDPDNPNNIIIGTGEVYGNGHAEPGEINRLTRGIYGLGILKTSDGGNSWTQVLDFAQENLKGVQDLEYNPQNSQEVYAATTDGLFQSLDGGDNWSLIFDEPNCMDVEVNPDNGDIVYVSQGNFNYDLDPNLSGIFKSTNKGASFTELIDEGLLSAWSGSAKIYIDPQDANTLFASIQVGWFNTGSTTPAGIFKSTNAGVTWVNINNQNIAKYQGWYSHGLAINPNNDNELFYVGIEAWKSTNGGIDFVNKSDWTGWDFGVVSVNEPEGTPNYVHADIHTVYYHPLEPSKVFMASDGGVFVTQDGGNNFTTLNGGLQTTQFYANIGSSGQTENKIIGGTQDNATYIYNGSSSWSRVIGGDGMCAGIHQDNDDIVFGSYQNLNIRKSTNGGISFSNAKPNLESDDEPPFNGQFELAPTNNDIIYAGAKYLYRSNNAASTWQTTSSQMVDGGNKIVKIAISPNDPDFIYLATAPDPLEGLNGAKLLKSQNGGTSFVVQMDLPNRICKDIVISPFDDDIAYAVFSGFGTNHVYKTSDGGISWSASDVGLPDVPTNCILIDPNFSDHVYVGNDLGVYFSLDAGENWQPWNEGLNSSMLVMDLNYSPSNNRIRIATHGRGIYERDLLPVEVAVNENNDSYNAINVYPNPARDMLTFSGKVDAQDNHFNIQLIDSEGKLTKSYSVVASLGVFSFAIEISSFPKGMYLYKISAAENVIQTGKVLFVE